MKFRSVLFASVLALLTVPALGQDQTATAGKVNSVDAAYHVLNLTHDAIPALGWPAMTMDFNVRPDLDLGGLKSGDAIRFTVGKAPDGTFRIDSLTVAK